MTHNRSRAVRPEIDLDRTGDLANSPEVQEILSAELEIASAEVRSADLESADLESADVKSVEIESAEIESAPVSDSAQGLEDDIALDAEDETHAADGEKPTVGAAQLLQRAAHVPIRSATYRPPPLAEGRIAAITPAFEADQDAEERALTKRESWEGLIELYLSRIQRAPSWSLKAKLFLKIASVFESKLNDPEQALDALLEAFDLSPVDDGTARGIERLAGPLNRWRDIVDRAKKS